MCFGVAVADDRVPDWPGELPTAVVTAAVAVTPGPPSEFLRSASENVSGGTVGAIATGSSVGCHKQAHASTCECTVEAASWITKQSKLITSNDAHK